MKQTLKRREMIGILKPFLPPTSQAMNRCIDLCHTRRFLLRLPTLWPFRPLLFPWPPFYYNLSRICSHPENQREDDFVTLFVNKAGYASCLWPGKGRVGKGELTLSSNTTATSRTFTVLK